MPDKKKRGGQVKAEEEKKVRHHFMAEPKVSEFLDTKIEKYTRSSFINEAVKAAINIEQIPAALRAEFMQNAIAEKLAKLGKSVTLQ